MGENYKAWNITVRDYSRIKTVHEKLELLVGFAVLAPSSHNAQPWKFLLGETYIDVMPDRTRALSESDPKEKNLYTTLGCAIENIVVAADYFGLQARVTYLPDEKREVAARIEFSFEKELKQGLDNPDHLIFSILKRCTNRNKYDPNKQLPEDFVRELSVFSGGGIDVHIIEKKKIMEQLTEIIMDARECAFDIATFRREIACYSKNNFTRSGVGITGNTMGFGNLQSIVAPFAVKNFNVIRLIRKQEEKLFSVHTSAHVVMGLKKETKQSWMKAGRACERMILIAGQKGISSAISIIPTTVDMKRLKKLLNTSYSPHIFLRLGYAVADPPHAPRLMGKEVLFTS